MERCRRFAVAALVALVLATPLRAWDEEGHKIIATIAGDHLNRDAKAELVRLAEQMPHSARTYNAVTLACWMDDIRSDKTDPDYGLFKSWHYIDIGLAPGDPMPSLEPGDDNEEHGNAIQALKRAVVVLKGGADPYIKSKAVACAIVMHLVCDIHQPLHCATKYFVSNGRLLNDKGGNDEFIVNCPNLGVPLNLHFFWDHAYQAAFNPDTGTVFFDPRHDAWIRRDESSPKGSLEPDFDAWARESNAIARDFVYHDLTEAGDRKHCRLSSAYIEKARAIAQAQLILAGWRLATLLNETLGSPQPVPPPSYPAGPPSTHY